MNCKKCGKEENVQDLKIKNEDLGPICSNCKSQLQDEYVKVTKAFMEKKETPV